MASIIDELIEQELSTLRKIRELLSQSTQGTGAAEKTVGVQKGKTHGRRKLSPEARERIAEAQKRRWAAFKKAAK